MNQFLSFEGKRILVTGASSGIGRETAISLSKYGANVVITGRNQDRLQETYELLDGNGHQAVIFDFQTEENYSALFDRIVSEGDKLSGMVHCAGIAKPVPIRAFTQAQIDSIMKVNFYSFLFLVSQYSKKKYADGGSIVGISAINAHHPRQCMSVYAASKSALEASVTTMALELAQKDIRINTVVPGAINTPMAKSYLESSPSLAERAVLGLGEPEDVAHLILFLLSDAARYITGRHYYVDGGEL